MVRQPTDVARTLLPISGLAALIVCWHLPVAGAAGTGAIVGTVTLRGDAAPGPTRVQNTTDPAVCGARQTLEDLLVSSGSRGIRNVIVSLEGVARDKIPPVAPGRLVLNNRQCRFWPHVSVVAAGSVIESTNSDPVLHTVHFYGAVEANVALPQKDMNVRTRADRPGMIIAK